MLALIAILVLVATTVCAQSAPERIVFSNGPVSLHGDLWKPAGSGPFPAVLFNHGSNSDAKGPERAAAAFTSRGFIFFVPFRRGQGASSDAGPYLGRLLDDEEKKNGKDAADKLGVRLLETEQLADVLAALAYLKQRPEVDKSRIAVGGVSYGGVQALLAAEIGTGLAAAVDFAGGAMSWPQDAPLRDRMLKAARNVKIPVLLVQAENDFDLGPTRDLFAEMTRFGKPCRMRIFPAFGDTKMKAHRFGFDGSDQWAPDVFRFFEENGMYRPSR